MARRRIQRDPGAFLRLPFVGVLAPGGLMDELTGDAFKLLVLALTVVDRRDGGLDHGGAQGLRLIPYSLVVRRFGWSPKKVACAFRELLDVGALVVSEPGGLVGGIRQPSAYQIGAAHPWSGKSRPTSAAGSGTATSAGSGTSFDATPPLPAGVVGPKASKRPFPKGFRSKQGSHGLAASSLPPPEERSRVSMYPVQKSVSGGPVPGSVDSSVPARPGLAAFAGDATPPTAGLPAGGEVVEFNGRAWYRTQVPDGARVCTRWFPLEERGPVSTVHSPRRIGEILARGNGGQGGV
jgi:hypothetical protein